MTVRYGIIGTGMMGQEHIRNVRLLEGAEIVAVCDPDEAMRTAAARMCGEVRVFEECPDLAAADGCDAFIVASPNDTHRAVLSEILPLGKPVLVEKPLCTTSKDCVDAIAMAERSGAPVWVAMEYRYMPPLSRLISEVAAGTAGRPVMMSIREHRYPFLPKVGDWNRFNRRTGGTMVEKCCHFWDLMRHVLQSDPIRVFASGGMDANHLDEDYGGESPDILDNAFAVAEFGNGARAMLDLCMFCEGSHWQETVSVTGPKARVDALVPGPARFAPGGEQRHALIEVHDRSERRTRTEEIGVDAAVLAAGDHHGATYFQHERFLKMVRSGGEPEVTLADGLWSVLVGEACERSARTGEQVALDGLPL